MMSRFIMNVLLALLLTGIILFFKKIKKPVLCTFIVTFIVFIYIHSMMNPLTDSGSGYTYDSSYITASINNEETTSEALSELFEDTISSEYTNLSVSEDAIENGYTLQYYFSDSAWDESHLVRTCLTDYINYCQTAYQFNNIDSIRFVVFSELTDSKGNSSYNNIMGIRMNKDEFNTFNWDSLAYQDIYNTFVSSCEDYWLDHSIADYIDTADIYYAP